MSWYRQQLEDWLKTLDVKAGTVLDIGGNQNPVKGRTKSWDVKAYKVLDLPEYDLNYGEYEAGNDVVGKAQLHYDSHFSRLVGTADIVFCLEVFDYIYDPKTALNNIKRCLRLDGKAYVTFPFVYPHHNELELDSLRYTEPGVKRLAESLELKVNNTWYRKDKSGTLKSFYAADGMRAAKEYHDHSITGFILELTK